MYEIFEVEGGYGFRAGQTEQRFWPFKEGFQAMTLEEAEQVAQCFDTPAGPHWTGDEVVPRIVAVVDKGRVVADDADKVTITATITDATNTDPVVFAVEGAEPVEVVPTDGMATLEVTFGAGNEGRKTITATHPRFGRNEVQLEVVAGE